MRVRRAIRKALWVWACGEGPDSPINRAFGLVAVVCFTWWMASGGTAKALTIVGGVAVLLTTCADWSRVFKWLRRRQQKPIVRVWNADFTESSPVPSNWRIETNHKEN